MTEETSAPPAKDDGMPDGAYPSAPANSQFLLIYTLAKGTLWKIELSKKSVFHVSLAPDRGQLTIAGAGCC